MWPSHFQTVEISWFDNNSWLKANIMPANAMFYNPHVRSDKHSDYILTSCESLFKDSWSGSNVG